MERIVERSLLFDFYGELLTDHQKEVYGEYIHNDLSVTEMAALMGISRQGAHDLIRRSEKILREYEEQLHLVEHFQKVKQMVSKIREYADEIAGQGDRDLILDRVSRIVEISDMILNEY